MQRKKPDVDIIKDILAETVKAYPGNNFVKSLLLQYEERGGLSRKQLEGLYQKALKIGSLPPQKLATLDAVIKKKPIRYKSAPPPPTPLYTRDERTGEMIRSVLDKYPQHKRVLFFKTKYENNESLSPSELHELERFCKLLK